MAFRRFWITVVFVAAAAAGARGQTIQLPEFHVFSVHTTVSVPDGGAAYLGGVARARSDAGSRGAPLAGKLPFAGRLFHNRGIAAGRRVAAAQASATIIDLDEMDRAVLAEAATRRGGESDKRLVEQPAKTLSAQVARSAPASGASSVQAQPLSVAEIQRRHQLADARRQQEAADFWVRGLAAESAGKLGAARVYYQLAARRAGGPLRQQAAARIKALQDREPSQLAGCAVLARESGGR
jgi:hypothetical protein